MSAAVVPPTSGLNTWFDSPNTPWQDAHLDSHTSWPLATLPDPGGRPLKSGRTSMSHAATSFGVASRPMPGNAALPCAQAPDAHSSTASASALTDLDILHLAAFLDQPR